MEEVKQNREQRRKEQRAKKKAWRDAHKINLFTWKPKIGICTDGSVQINGWKTNLDKISDSYEARLKHYL